MATKKTVSSKKKATPAAKIYPPGTYCVVSKERITEALDDVCGAIRVVPANKVADAIKEVSTGGIYGRDNVVVALLVDQHTLSGKPDTPDSDRTLLEQIPVIKLT